MTKLKFSLLCSSMPLRIIFSSLLRSLQSFFTALQTIICDDHFFRHSLSLPARIILRLQSEVKTSNHNNRIGILQQSIYRQTSICCVFGSMSLKDNAMYVRIWVVGTIFTASDGVIYGCLLII